MIKQHFGALFVKGDIAEFIADDQVIFLKFAFQGPQCTGGMTFSDLGQELGHLGKQNAMACHAGSDPKTNRNMGLPGSGAAT